MAIDGKYGRVSTEHGNIGEDEPVIVFRAQDKLLPNVLSHYVQLCEQAGSPSHHIARVEQSLSEVLEWQASNFTKVPTSDSLAPN